MSVLQLLAKTREYAVISLISSNVLARRAGKEWTAVVVKTLVISFLVQFLLQLIAVYK